MSLLRQPRPKSQPAIKYNSIANQKQQHQEVFQSQQQKQKITKAIVDKTNFQHVEHDDDWNRLMLSQYRGDNEERQKSSNTCHASVSLSNLSSSSSSSSSSTSSSASEASSLVCSSLSISTNSSTSTVLAALNTMNNSNRTTTTTSSMIAKYSDKNNNNDNVNCKTNKQPYDRMSSSIDGNSDDDEDQNQLLLSSSSSSSASSSSGLSSMNSSIQKQQITKSQFNKEEQQQIQSSKQVKDKDVEEFLNDLCDTVAQEQAESGTLLMDKYSTFKLEEAVLAQTGSATSSGSSDEETTTTKEQNYSIIKMDKQQAVKLSNLTISSKIYLVRELEINSELQSDAFILHSAKRYMSSILVQKRKSKITKNWFVNLKIDDECAIEWFDLDRAGQEGIERLEFNQIVDCLIEDQLLVWVINRNRIIVNKAEELETTLDDIAMALDEPVNQGESAVSTAANNTTAPYGVETLIWFCSDENEAKRFLEHYNMAKAFFKEQLNRGREKTTTTGFDFEIETNPMEIENGNRCEKKALLTNDDSELLPPSSGSLLTKDKQQQQQKQVISSFAKESQSSALGEAGAKGKQLMASIKSSFQYLNEKNKLTTSLSSPVTTGEKVSRSYCPMQTNATYKLEENELVNQHQHHQSSVGRKNGLAVDMKTSVSSSLPKVSLTPAANNGDANKMVQINSDSKQATKMGGNNDRVGQQNQQSSIVVPMKNRQVIMAEAAAAAANVEIGALNNGGNGKKDKQRLKKSLSGLDLSSNQSASSSSTSLAGYYKSVANKVLSNGQSKIKSFKDEMIKFNNRTPTTTTSHTSSNGKRISMSGNNASYAALQSSRSPAGKLNDSNSLNGSTPNLSSSIRAASNENVTSFEDHQQRIRQQQQQQRSSITTTSAVKSVLPKNSSTGLQGIKSSVGLQSSSQMKSISSSSKNSTFKVEAVDNRIPEIKPRTSILKNRQQAHNKSNPTCDINNNNNNNGTKSEQTIRKCSIDNNNDLQAEQQKLSSRLSKCEITTSSTKPKSILKTTKSVSSNNFECSKVLTNTDKFMTDNNQSLVKRTATSNLASNINYKRRSYAFMGNNSKDIIGNNNQQEASFDSSLQRKQPHKLNNAQEDVCYLSENKLDKNDDDHDEVDDDGDDEFHTIDTREQSFERLRLRASCYDLSRLMSKNGLQNQLNKLRSGSANSISTSKSRQRRPALLIDSNDNDDDEIKEITTTKSGADGTVRARVSASQLQQSSQRSSMVIQQNNYNDNNRQGTGCAIGCGEPAAATHGSESVIHHDVNDSSVGQCKKSEFDPRSLRRMPAGMKKISNESDNNDNNICRAEKEARRKSITSIRLLSQHKEKEDTNNQQQRQTNKEATKQQAIEKTNIVSVISNNNKYNHDNLKQTLDEVAKKHEHSLKTKSEKDKIGTKENDKKELELEDDDDDDEEETSTIINSDDEDELTKSNRNNSTLSKTGPFSLLRQSFNQKTLSSMLKFSSRASLRVKSSQTTATTSPNESSQATTTSIKTNIDKANAIAIAEANLLAAKKLKQQAQKLKEQQKREQQQAANAMIDPTSMMLAVQYNQQIQRQQQQQQILYQQYAIAARGQMFDATSVHLQHAQMMYQRQHQQQQMASYMASINSAQYMAQQIAAAMPGPAQPAPAMHLSSIQAQVQAQPTSLHHIQHQFHHHHHQQQHQQQLMYQLGSMQQVQTNSNGNNGSVFKKSILKGGSKSSQMIYHHQQQQQQQTGLIPMSVNHHSSSFNIVYNAPGVPQTITTTPSTTEQQQQNNAHIEQQAMKDKQQTLAKRSSLGASMRKTVKSILINRSSFLSNNSANQQQQQQQTNSKTGTNNDIKITNNQQVKVLKSALKSSPSREIVLNSEGSDGDGSSSDSTTTLTTSNSSTSSDDRIVMPKSVLKKTNQQQQHLLDDTNLSDSSNDTDYIVESKQSTLTRTSANDYRKRITSLSMKDNQSGTIRASTRRKSVAGNQSASGRKNVTFSKELTLL